MGSKESSRLQDWPLGEREEIQHYPSSPNLEEKKNREEEKKKKKTKEETNSMQEEANESRSHLSSSQVKGS